MPEYQLLNRCMRCTLLLLLCTTALSGQETVTLQQCYESARANYPQVKRFGLIADTEQYNLSNAGKGWLPQLTVSGRATYQSDVTQLPFDGDKMSAIIPGFNIPVMSKDQYQVSAELSQTIWDGGTIRSVRETTRAEANATREQLESELYALNDRVNQLFFGCLLQDELLRQNGILQKELQVNIDRIAAMIANGVANQSDKESMEVELLNARQREIELKASRKAFGQMLGALTSRPIETAVLEKPILPNTSLSPVVNRPELRAFDAQNQLMESQGKLLTSGIMPKVGAFIQGGYGRPGLNMLEDSFEPFYIAGVRFSWNLGKFYTLKDDRRKIETSLRQIDVQRETFLFNTNLLLIQQNTEVEKMNSLIRSDDEIIRLRSNIKHAGEVKLENGVISVTDLIREINAEDMAKQAATTHRIQQLMAFYNYQYTTNND